MTYQQTQVIQVILNQTNSKLYGRRKNACLAMGKARGYIKWPQFVTSLLLGSKMALTSLPMVQTLFLFDHRLSKQEISMARLMAKPICVIPARMDSSRFPGKSLEPMLNMPLCFTCMNDVDFTEFEEVLVATCDEVIRQAVIAHGGTCVMTQNTLKGALTGLRNVYNYILRI